MSLTSHANSDTIYGRDVFVEYSIQEGRARNRATLNGTRQVVGAFLPFSGALDIGKWSVCVYGDFGVGGFGVERRRGSLSPQVCVTPSLWFWL